MFCLLVTQMPEASVFIILDSVLASWVLKNHLESLNAFAMKQRMKQNKLHNTQENYTVADHKFSCYILAFFRRSENKLVFTWIAQCHLGRKSEAKYWFYVVVLILQSSCFIVMCFPIDNSYYDETCPSH